VRDAELHKKIAQLYFQLAYQSDRKARSDLPLLAITCLTVRVGNMPPYMELQCSTGQSVKMALTGELIQALASMLQLATREANWVVAMTMTNLVQVSNEATSKPILH
jgi:hypothetical protein